MALENKTMGPRSLGFVLSEANGHLSYETVTIASGAGVLEPGTVLGEITASGKWIPSPDAQVVGSEGAETAKAVLGYRVDATSADADAVVMRRLGEVKALMLSYDASVDDANKIAAKHDQLAAAGTEIIAR